MLLEHRQRLLCEALQLGSLPRLGVPLELVDVRLVVAHHLVHVGLVELGVRALLQLVMQLLPLLGHLLGQLDALALHDLQQLLVRLTVVFDHALPELHDLVARRLLLGQLAQPHLHDAALGRFGREIQVFLPQLVLHLLGRPLLGGILALRERRLRHRPDQRRAGEQVSGCHLALLSQAGGRGWP